MKRIAYENLHLLPSLVARCVAEDVYTGHEVSDRLRSGSQVQKVEALRIQMTQEAIEEFVNLCDMRCRAAYEAKAKYFMKCLRGNNGRDQLYVWVSHWLSAFLLSPESFRRSCGEEPKRQPIPVG